MSDALGMEISVSVGCAGHLLCCKRIFLPALVFVHAELEDRNFPSFCLEAAAWRLKLS